MFPSNGIYQNVFRTKDSKRVSLNPVDFSAPGVK